MINIKNYIIHPIPIEISLDVKQRRTGKNILSEIISIFFLLMQEIFRHGCISAKCLQLYYLLLFLTYVYPSHMFKIVLNIISCKESINAGYHLIGAGVYQEYIYITLTTSGS